MADQLKDDERFDASQYAFFGGDVSQEVELGGLDEEDDILLRGAFCEEDEKEEVEALDSLSQSDVDIAEVSNLFTNLGRGLHDLELNHGPSKLFRDQQLQLSDDAHALHMSASLLKPQWKGDESGFPNSSFAQYMAAQSVGLSQNMQQATPHGSVPNSSYKIHPTARPSVPGAPFLQYGPNQILNRPSLQTQWVPSNMHRPLPGEHIQGYFQQHISQQNSSFSPPSLMQMQARLSSPNLQQSFLNPMPSSPPLSRGDGRDYPLDFHQRSRRSYQQNLIDSGERIPIRQPFRSKYMSAEEIESIARIQLAATHITDAYIDDYYHQAVQAKLARGAQHVRRPFAPSHLRDLPSHRRAPISQPAFVPVDGLGRVAFSSIRRPRPLLEVDDSSEPTGGNKESVRPLEQEPMLAARIAVEDGLCFLLDVDDIDRYLAATRPADGGVHLKRQRQMILESLAASLHLVDNSRLNDDLGSMERNEQAMVNGRRDDFLFLRLIASLSKGRKLIYKYLKLLPQGSMLVQIVCMAVFHHLSFIFGVPQTDPTAAGATIELAKAVADCAARMDLNSLSTCLAVVVLSTEPPPLKPFGSGSDGASFILKSVLDRATELLTDSRIMFSMEERALWQATFDHFFLLLYTSCTNKFDSILHSVAMSSPAGRSASINTVAAGAMSKEMPIELLRSSLPHMNEQQRKSLLDFTQRSIAFGAGGGKLC